MLVRPSLALLLLAATGPPLAPAPPMTSPAVVSRSTTDSGNWAGCVRPATREVSARWRVPTVAPFPAGSASTWVGIDGTSSACLAQVGTCERAAGGRVGYGAWWEVATPSGDTTMRSLALAVRPGDTVAAQVAITGGTARMTLRNRRTGRVATATAPYRGPGASAEWIQEDVEVNGWISPAPRWSPVTFTALTRNALAVAPTRAEGGDIVDGRGVRETRTGLPTRVGFTVTRIAAGGRTANS